MSNRTPTFVVNCGIFANVRIIGNWRKMRAETISQVMSRSDCLSKMWLVVFAGLLTCTISCRPSPTVVNESFELPVPASELELDLGIIFSNESNYFCVAFDRLKINPDISVVGIESSCSCAVASLVTFDSPNGRSRGLRVDFVKEETTRASHTKFASLGVEVTIRLLGGACRKVVFKILLTRLYTHAAKVETDECRSRNPSQTFRFANVTIGDLTRIVQFQANS